MTFWNWIETRVARMNALDIGLIENLRAGFRADGRQIMAAAFNARLESLRRSFHHHLYSAGGEAVNP